MLVAAAPPCAPVGVPDDPAARRRAFAVVFLIELWERFGFYGMAALMVLFMVQGLGYADERANMAWGALSALVYAMPVLGGWLGDRWIGARRAMLAGTAVLGCGYGLLALAGHASAMLFSALALISVGNGLFKPNAANLVRRIYEGDPARIDSAFTIYYMAVNIGSTISMLATPWVQQRWGWQAAFGVCAAGLLLGLLNYALMRGALATMGLGADDRRLPARRLLAVAAGLGCVALLAAVVLRHLALASACVVVVGVTVVLAWGVLMRRCSLPERRGMATAALLVGQTALFFVFYQQMATSLTLFALRNVDCRVVLPGLGGIELLPAQFQALNPLWIMLLSPPLAWLYARLARGRGDLPMGLKFAIGFAAVAASFALLAAGCLAARDGLVDAWFMVGGYGLLSLGELLLSGLGLAVIARHVPSRMSGFVMGAYFAVVGVAMYVGGFVANAARVPAEALAHAQASLPVYLGLFGRLSLLSLAGCAVSLAVLPWLRRLASPSAPAAQG